MHWITLAYWKEDTQNNPASCVLAVGEIPSQEMGAPREYINLCNVIRNSHQGKDSDTSKLLDCSGQPRLELCKINETLEKL